MADRTPKRQKTDEFNEYTLPLLKGKDGQPVKPVEGPVCILVCDGFGINDMKLDHNCVGLAESKDWEDWTTEAQNKKLYTALKAHGTAVGLPTEGDMGNSEVGHNALGSGQIVDQGAKLVNSCLANGALFASEEWDTITQKGAGEGKTVHFVGLLSDGGIHSNINQLVKILQRCGEDGIARVRVHVLTDGRDCSNDSHPIYMKQLEEALQTCQALVPGGAGDYKIASGGGRMYSTMDRYDADWNMVKRGWDAMVLGTIDESITPEVKDGFYQKGRFKSMGDWSKCVIEGYPDKDDQWYPPFVIVDDEDQPVGAVNDGDVVINFNYRGDRAIELSRAFTENAADFGSIFDRVKIPGPDFNVDYYGMLVYDSDKMIPPQSLAPNPDIQNVLSHYLLANDVPCFAVAETHKYGHMTYFWNGNRSGYINKEMETYCEVASQPATPAQLEQRPGMEAVGITDKFIDALDSKKYKCLRLNYANGDMCGHTGLIPPTTESIKIMFDCIKRVIAKVKELKGAVIITADHGNCEQMLQKNVMRSDKNNKPLTSHTLHPVPFVIIDDNANYEVDTSTLAETPGLANVAASVLSLLGLETPSKSKYHPSLIKYKD